MRCIFLEKPDTEYKTIYDYIESTTTIAIIYKGIRVLSLEYSGIIGAAAVREYATEAVQLLIDKGVIKREAYRS